MGSWHNKIQTRKVLMVWTWQFIDKQHRSCISITIFVPNIWLAGLENVGIYCFSSAIWLVFTVWVALVSVNTLGSWGHGFESCSGKTYCARTCKKNGYWEFDHSGTLRVRFKWEFSGRNLALHEEELCSWGGTDIQEINSNKKHLYKFFFPTSGSRHSLTQ